MLRIPHVSLKPSLRYLNSCTMQILRSSRGRYKVFGIIQCLSALYKHCMLDYLASYRIKEWPSDVRMSKTLQDAMRNGQKIFRLLRWIEEIGNIDSNLKKPGDLLSILKFLRHFFGIFYYIFDNIVWVAEAGVINKYISDPRWKWENAKNVFSLIRYFLLVVITLLKRKKINQKEKLCRETLIRRQLPIDHGNEGEGLMNQLNIIRHKWRFNMLTLIKNILRIFMLYRAIKLPGYIRISMIFHDVCGISSYALGVAKIFFHQLMPLVQKKKLTQCSSMDTIYK